MNSVPSKVFWPVVAVLGVWLAVLTAQTVKSPSVADKACAAGGPVVAHKPVLDAACVNHVFVIDHFRVGLVLQDLVRA